MRNTCLVTEINSGIKNIPGKETIKAKPFLKWAGGKTQLLNEFSKRLPESIVATNTIKRYIEPFVGGGAMFFFLKRFFHVEEAYLFDINKELIIGYKVIQNNPKELINLLKEIEDSYLSKSVDGRREFYYEVRSLYNKKITSFTNSKYSKAWIERAAFLIFLNKTCFNGLFRQNQKGEFNVPFGRYKKPKICDTENILQVHRALDNTEIYVGDFTEAEKYIERNSFVYFDPPYRPLNATSSFTSYNKEGFDEEDQIRLAKFFRKTSKKGAYVMLSNSDPKNYNPDDDFFEKQYSSKGITIERVSAKRYINCDSSKRGEINELIIRNY